MTPSALGYVTSDSAVSNCTTTGGVCTATVPAGTVIHLGQTGFGSAFPVGWSGDCSGTTCTLTMDQDHAVAPLFADFNISLETTSIYSEVQGETRELRFTVSAVAGSASLPVSLSSSTLPQDETATFNPQTGSIADGSPLLGTAALSAATTTPLGQTSVTITASSGTQTRSASFTLEVRSPLVLVNPVGVALEAGGTTALVVESENAARLTRISTATKSVLHTVASLPSSIAWPRGLALESGGATALVTYDNALARVDLATGARTDLTTALHTPLAVALEPGGATALVTDCNTNSDCNNAGRVVRVTLGTGADVQVSNALTAFAYPAGIAIEPDGLHADVIETNAARLSRVRLSNGSVTTVNGGLSGYPEAVAMEADGNHVLVGANNGTLLRVQVKTGIMNFVAQPGGVLGGLALSSDGNSALLTIHTDPGFARFAAVPNLFEVIAPSALTSTDTLDSPSGIALEAGGATALVADFCSGGACGAGATGRLSRVDLGTGNVTALDAANALVYPQGIQLQPGGASVLVAEQSGDRLSAVSLSDGSVTPFSQQELYAGPVSVLLSGAGVVESSGGFNSPSLRLVDEDGGYTTLPQAGPWACCKEAWQMELEGDGGSFLYAWRNGTPAGDPNGSPNAYNTIGELQRYTFGAASPISTVVEGLDVPSGIGIEDGGTVIVAEYGGANAYGRMVRADPSTGQYGIISTGLMQIPNSGGEFYPRFLNLEPSGPSALVTYGRFVARASLTPLMSYQRVTGPYESPQGLVLESGGTTGLLTTCGTTYLTDCAQNGGLVRLDLASQTSTQLLSGLNTPHAVALENAGSALISDCGPLNASGGCSSNGRILRVNLAAHSTSILTPGLNDPRCITFEPTGTALICEYGTGRILRMDPADGSFVPIASGLSNPVQVTLEPNGTTALVGVQGGIVRMDLTSGAISNLGMLHVGQLPNGAVHFALSSDGLQALAVTSGSAFAGALLRVDTQTGGVDVLHPGLTDVADTIIPYGNGEWLVVEARPRTGAVFLLAP